MKVSSPADLYRNSMPFIKNMIYEHFKINPSLMNPDDNNHLHIHISNILAMKNDSDIRSTVRKYIKENEKSMKREWKDIIEISILKSEIDLMKTQNDEIGKLIQPILKFNDEKMMNARKQTRKNLILKGWHLLVVVSLIRTDFNDMMNYIKENQANDEVLSDISQVIKQKYYRIDRDYYSFDLIADNNQLHITKFNIKKDRIHAEREGLSR